MDMPAWSGESLQSLNSRHLGTVQSRRNSLIQVGLSNYTIHICNNMKEKEIPGRKQEGVHVKVLEGRGKGKLYNFIKTFKKLKVL